MRTALALALLLCSACTPVLKGTADVRLRALLEAPPARPEAVGSLLAPDVEVHTRNGAVKGAAEGAESLAEVKPDGPTGLLRHHDVSLLLLGDGRTVLLQRDGQDRITRAVELPAPGPGDPMPQRMVWYGAAWNVDDGKARQALCDASYAEGARYVDPGHEVHGPAEVCRMIGSLRLVAPGSVLHYTTGLADAGGGWATESWIMLSRLGGRVLFRGIDVLHFGPDGKIDFLAGFIGERAPR